MFMFETNQPIKVIHLQKLANQSILNGALVIEIVTETLYRNKFLVSECIFKYSLSL